MKVPTGKTVVEITSKGEWCTFNVGDVGYIDGYILGGDGRPYAVVVGPNGGIDLVSTTNLRAI